ncbi:MAG: 16S rRNA (cytosine(1402)-N(4))-methyltransferase RsmH [Betaproteobacteria bacterium]|nr:16S rRNA (cytosine(1402)-N(4))-methyltransferase RsmH [Betaproteobacteria bacterium]
MNARAHSPVLLHEALAGLALARDGIYVDATFGRGGHSRLILERLGPSGRLFAMDRDRQAIEAGATIKDARFTLIHGHFGTLAQALSERGLGPGAAAVSGALSGVVNGILMDLGMSSPQLDESERGFTFRVDGPLDMRMDQTQGMTAADWLANAGEQEIGEVIRGYGEERFAKQIAKAIVAARERGPITRTRQLADIVGSAVRTREPGKDPSTRTFQAIRIYINKELEELSLALPQAVALLVPGGRLTVISFHSLEDRIVKRFMRDAAGPGVMPERLPVRAAELPPPRLRIVSKPVRPGPAEVHANPRARSAILRVAERLP